MVIQDNGTEEFLQLTCTLLPNLALNTIVKYLHLSPPIALQPTLGNLYPGAHWLYIAQSLHEDTT